MIDEHLFIETIEKATKLKLNDFGFISGTFYPFSKTPRGLASAMYQEGFIIWKKTKDKYLELHVKYMQSGEENLKDCITFILCDDEVNKIIFSDTTKYKLQ